MRLVVDASVLVAELLRVSGRKRIASQRLDLISAEHTLAEAHHEILRRTVIIGERQGLTSAEVTQRQEPIFDAMTESITPLDMAVYEPVEPEVAWRIERDPNDWHVVAAALVLDCGIWTSDQDFFGSGIATWSTVVLDRWLSRSAEADTIS